MLHLKTAKLARWQVRTLSWSGSILWLTGVAWLLLHNFGQIHGEFGPEANPAEPWLLRLHGAALIVATAGAGGLLLVHVWRGWGYKNQRVLGSTLSASAVLLILTGYLLYYVGDEVVRPWISIAHWVVGLGIAPIFLLHYGRRTRARATLPPSAVKSPEALLAEAATCRSFTEEGIAGRVSARAI